MKYYMICRKENQESIKYKFSDEYYAKMTKEEKERQGYTVEVITKTDE